MSPYSNDRGRLVSVVVCTYLNERIGQLMATLESLNSQVYEPREIIVVVDHNPPLAARLEATLDSLARVIQSAGPKGLSGARNTGVKQARGEIIAFIDDDATADSSWLERLVDAYSDDLSLAAGGRIIPVWEGDGRPRWFPEEFLWVVGCTYRGVPERGLVRNVIGANMSFRSTVFQSIGGFDASVGRIDTQPLGCEETELCIRALKYSPGGRILYLPEAIVHHYVPKARQTVGYFVRRCFSEGLSKAYVRRLVGSEALSSESNYLVKALVPAVGRNVKNAVLLKDPRGSIGQATAISAGLLATAVGFMVGSVRWRRDEPKT